MFQGNYTTKRGDTLAAIAERYQVSLSELRRVNGIAVDQSAAKAGTVLAIPARGTAPPRVVQVKPVTTVPPDPKVASVAPPSPAPEAKITSVRFRWPVAGKVISTFGPQPDGSMNDGIKLAVPLSTDIRAAERGHVDFAGDGSKGYGNLIRIRHANGWVSTYAHATKMLVKVGDEVKRGHVIGKSGQSRLQSSPVDVPQLGFELRKDSMPVDPLAHLAGN